MSHSKIWSHSFISFSFRCAIWIERVGVILSSLFYLKMIAPSLFMCQSRIDCRLHKWYKLTKYPLTWLVWQNNICHFLQFSQSTIVFLMYYFDLILELIWAQFSLDTDRLKRASNKSNTQKVLDRTNNYWCCLVSFFNDISTFVGYLMPEISLWKNKRDTI